MTRSAFSVPTPHAHRVPAEPSVAEHRRIASATCATLVILLLAAPVLHAQAQDSTRRAPATDVARDSTHQARHEAEARADDADAEGAREAGHSIADGAREAAVAAREMAGGALEVTREMTREMARNFPDVDESDTAVGDEGELTNVDSTFRWDGAMTSGTNFRLYTINGPVSVEPSADGAAHVRAIKRWRHGNPADVRVEVVRAGSDVTVCALWTPESRCTADGVRGDGHSNNRDNDTRVDFTVQLPAGVRSDLNTVNGSVTVSGVSAPVSAETVNGRIEAASVRGPVTAETVNGSIVARMDSLTGSGDLSYETVNGSITIELPASAAADVSLSTVNGSLSSDFPLTVNGTISPRRLRAVLGGGGRKLSAETVNGGIRLVKRGT